MQVFKYTGFDQVGHRVSGELAAESRDQAESILESRAILLVSVLGGKASELPKLKKQLIPSHGKQRPVKTMEAAVILRNLAVMTENGVTLVEALEGIIDSVRNDQVQARLERVRDDIVGGKSFSAAVQSEVGLFPSLICDMVRVGEDGGKLPTALAGAATYLERAANLKRKVMNALLYPSIMAFISFVTVLILVVFILPNFEDIFSQMSIELPASTTVMMGFGSFLRKNFLLSIGLTVGACLGFRSYLRTENGAKLCSRLLLRLPVVGDLVRKLSISRALQSMSALLSSNVPLIVALEHGARVSGSLIVEQGFFAAKERVEQGAALSDALSQSPVFPKVLTQMVVAGERTGKLSAMLQPIADAMEEEADSKLKALTSIIEPVIVVGMGIAVGFVTLAIVVPIFSIAENF